MLREISSSSAGLAHLPTETSVDMDDYFKLGTQLRRLLDRVALPKRWSIDEVRDVQKSLKDVIRELDRQAALGSGGDSRASAVRQARAALTMSVSSVPTPAWYLCLLAACESLTIEATRRAN